MVVLWINDKLQPQQMAQNDMCDFFYTYNFYTVGHPLFLDLCLIKFAVSNCVTTWMNIYCVYFYWYYLNDLLPPLSVLLMSIQGSSG